jgi:hypothetical protein
MKYRHDEEEQGIKPRRERRSSDMHTAFSLESMCALNHGKLSCSSAPLTKAERTAITGLLHV